MFCLSDESGLFHESALFIWRVCLFCLSAYLFGNGDGDGDGDGEGEGEGGAGAG